MLGRLAPVGRRRVGALALQVKLDSRRPRVSCHWGQGCPVRVQTKPGSGSQPCSTLAPQAASRSQKNGCKSHAHLSPWPLVLSTHPVLSIKHQNAILCMCALPSASMYPQQRPYPTPPMPHEHVEQGVVFQNLTAGCGNRTGSYTCTYPLHPWPCAGAPCGPPPACCSPVGDLFP